jgi:hypothetical protein
MAILLWLKINLERERESTFYTLILVRIVRFKEDINDGQFRLPFIFLQNLISLCNFNAIFGNM